MRDTILLLDDMVEITRLLKVELARLATDKPIKIVAFHDDLSASNFISARGNQVFGIVQDMYRNVSIIRPDGAYFWSSVIRTMLPEARTLILSGSSNVSELFEIGKLDSGQVRFADKAKGFDGIRDELIWLLNGFESGSGEPTAAKRVELFRSLELPWYEVRKQIALRPDLLSSLESRTFEKLMAGYFESYGWNVELTGRTRDGGHDIIAVRRDDPTNLRVLIEAKRWSPDRPVGVEIVRALYGVRSIQAASQVVLATTSFVSPDAKREFSRVTPWELDFIERDKILSWCARWDPEINLSGEVPLNDRF